MKKAIYLRGISFFTLATLACPVQAQTGGSVPSVDAAIGASEYKDIIVTANRREENAQRVAVSVIALGTEALEERNVRTLGDLTAMAPGLRFAQQGGGASMNIVMRGLQRSPAGSAPSAVISYFADIPISSNGSNLPVYDLASVQVLKGPQGTLFGRNAIGGAVVITPQAPTDKLEGYIRGSYGNYDYKDVEGAINLPIVGDRVALRLAGKVSRRDGYTEIIGPGRDGDNINSDSFRASLLLQPTDTIRNTTVFDWFRADEGGAASIVDVVLPIGVARIPQFAHFYDCNTINAFNQGCAAIPGVLAAGYDIDDAFARQQQAGKRTSFSNIRQSLYRKTWGISNRTEFDVTDGLTLRNIFGYRRTNVSTNLNVDGQDSARPLADSSVRSRQEQLSDEFQAYGKILDNKLDYLVGLFYIKENPTGPEGTAFAIAAPAAPWVSAYTTKTNKAVFGQVSFALTDTLKLTGGIRYNETRQTSCAIVGQPPVAAANLFTAEPPVGPEACLTSGGSRIATKESATTYNVGIDWRVTENIFAYITHRKGYREGGLNFPLYNTPCTTGGATGVCATNASPPDLRPYQSYQPETVKDIELGLKTEFPLADGRARINLAAYRTTYTNAAVSFNTSGIVATTDLGAPQFSSVSINVGDRRIKGVELETLLQPTRNFSVQNNVSYTQATILSNTLPNLPGLQLPSVLPASPTWAISTSVRWVLPFRPADGEIVANADIYHQSKYFVGNDTIPGYEVANARIEWSGIAQSGFSVAGFVRNLFDSTYPIASVAGSSSLSFLTRAYAEPRMYGVELGYKF